MDFREILSQMQETWGIARTVKGSSYISIIDGSYKAAITDLKMKESRNGNLIIMREWTILEGDYINTTFRDYISFTDIGLRQIQNFIIQMGYEIPEDITEIDDLMLEILKDRPICEIKVRIKEDFAKVIIINVEEKEKKKENLLSRLNEFCYANDIKISEKDSDESTLIKMIKERKWEAKKLIQEEIELLVKIGATVTE